MSFTRRQWLGASAASILGAVTAGMKLSPLAQAMAATELSPAAQLAALKAFSGSVAHATHYGPLMATVQKGRIVKIDAQASDKMPTARLKMAPMVNWPSPPIFQSWFLKAMEVPRAIIIRGTAFTSVSLILWAEPKAPPTSRR